MRILLVMPTPYETGRLGLENVVWLSEPVALTSIAAMVCHEHEVKVLDMRLEHEDVLARTLRSFQPDLVGTTSMTTDVYQAKAVLRMTRAIVPGALTVVGGHAPTLQPESFEAPYVDVIVQGEGEETFAEICARWSEQRHTGKLDLRGVHGTRSRVDERSPHTPEQPATLRYHVAPKRAQVMQLDALPAPNRKLIAQYQGRYFFTAAKPMASIFTSRGCSFDCNFCAIWEFYERRTRYLSADKIVDQMQACDEPFIFLLDDNFLTNKKRIVAFCDEIERRNVKKLWMTQGRTDFVADNPELIARLASCGLVGLLSGFESNDDDNLAALRKKNTYDKNLRANAILRDNGIFSTGIFMVRADWTAAQFDSLYEYINTLEIGIPLVTILTPLPGTQLYRTYQDVLMTTDFRLFDLLHAVLPTRLPRAEFYAQFARAIDATEPSCYRAMRNLAKKRPELIRALAWNIPWFYARTWRYQRLHRDATSFLRDEEGLLNGPGAQKLLTWQDVAYPSANDNTTAADSGSQPPPVEGKLLKLRISRRLWTDDLPRPANDQATGGE